MASYQFSPRAEADLEDIWRYTSQNWSSAQADRYVSDIFDAVQKLADGILTGRSVDVRAGYLKHRCGSHMLYFRSDDVTLIVVRILHQSMDTQRHL